MIDMYGYYHSPDIKYGVECIKNKKPEKSGEDEIYLFPQAV